MSSVADTQLSQLLEAVRRGRFDAALATRLDQLSLDEVVGQLRGAYPAVFLERAIGRKREMGLARSIRWELGVGIVGSPPAPTRFGLVLRGCVLVSGYDGRPSELTIARGLRVQPHGKSQGRLRVRMLQAFKLDRTPDGWALKSVPSQVTVLPEELLVKQGWDQRILSFAYGYPGIQRNTA